MKHTRATHAKDLWCGPYGCNVCNLFICSVCNCAEGTLPTECPGYVVSEDKQDLIYRGKLDFINNTWQDK